MDAVFGRMCACLGDRLRMITRRGAQDGIWALDLDDMLGLLYTTRLAITSYDERG